MLSFFKDRDQGAVVLLRSGNAMCITRPASSLPSKICKCVQKKKMEKREEKSDCVLPLLLKLAHSDFIAVCRIKWHLKYLPDLSI